MTDVTGVTTVADTVTALRGVADVWAARPLQERLDVLGRWAGAIRARRSTLVDALARDTGRRGLSEMEVDSVLSSIARHSEWAHDVLSTTPTRGVADPGVSLIPAPVPLGVVGVVSPWNFPLQLALIDAVPALIAGCVAVVKPSELTPGFVPELRASIEAVPELAQVLALVEGGPETGVAVVDAVDVVCFTGSVRTGRRVAAHAAERFIPAFLELGGKDAAVVTATADLDVASSAIVWGSTANTGQSCMSIERVYVEAQVAEEFTAAVVAKAQRVVLALGGPGEGDDLGPFIDPRQADVVIAQIEDAVAKGATVACGGTLQEHDSKRFLAPTVLTGVDHDMVVMTEETFGPVIPIMVVPDTDEAIRLANDTQFGLSGAVFADDDRAYELASRMLAGGISVNDICLTGMVPEGEKQAFKQSGLGPTRMGPAALRRFQRQRVLLHRESPRVQPWWYDG
ncbi:aldehyde dehydrogenase family protein [Ornithinimicrobium faecis]|uniref:aldehyde dehydrogenase family protein n=1 Tax=Ornithinimicrobium faecis TaxID=2934158 RepID=UPI0021179453|nr:aldehyde dehydrogenase family protein [Ornithinimicrobium sp. HY1745]